VRIAVISDIHSNAHALRAALEVIESHSVGEIYCLGDVVGYGADPAECIELVRERCTATVLGNHDEVVAFERGAKVIPKDAQKAAEHNRNQLSSDQLEWLRALPLRVDSNGFTFVHASPQSPDAWLRLDSFMRVKEQFNHFDGDVCFVGHTHLPGVASDRLGVLSVRPGHRYMVNCGSIGQPRDDDPRLSLAIFDTAAFSCEIIRSGYDVEAAAQRIRDEGLPDGLADILFRGR
jgi:putative phosphoesterase